MAESVFTRIIRRELPADIVYEDDKVICIKDINPKAPVHLLLIPKKPIVSLAHLSEDDAELMGHLTVQIPKIAKMVGLDGGFRVIVNTGRDGGQEIDHLHYHILGGRRFGFE